MHDAVRYATAAVAALLVQVTTATAATDPPPFSAAADRGGLMSCRQSPGLEPNAWVLQPARLELALAEVPTPMPVEISGIYYRPKPNAPEHHESHRSSDNDVTSVSQFHAGYFTPDGGLGTRFDLGVRGGPLIGHAFQLGIAADWMYRTEDISRPITTSIGPGGVPITQTQEHANATVNMFPIMAFAQLNVLDFLGFKPYVGGAAGYQVMLLSGKDFTTGESFDATFGGWGWQYWAGAGLPLNKHSRLFGEAFVNDVDMGRDIKDPDTGESTHETVNGGGKGLRFGLAWGF